MSLQNIQERLDELDPGGILALERGDYDPCVIRKPVILLCDGATFWTDGKVPSIAVRSDNVVIKDADLRSLSSPENTVITAGPGSYPLLQNVRIYGRAVGVEADPSEWILPPRIDTGEISVVHPGLYLDFAVSQRSQIVCRISGVSLDPAALNPGVNTVKLQIRDAMPDSILIGEVEIIGSTLTRLIPFSSRLTATAPSALSSVSLVLLEIPAHEKERFQRSLVGIASGPPPVSNNPNLSPHPKVVEQKTHTTPAPESSQKRRTSTNNLVDSAQTTPRKPKPAPPAKTDPLTLGSAFSSSHTVDSNESVQKPEQQAVSATPKRKAGSLFDQTANEEPLAPTDYVNNSTGPETCHKDSEKPITKITAPLSKLFRESTD